MKLETLRKADCPHSKDDAMRIQLDVNAVAASQWEISGFSKLGNEITPGPPPRFGCYRWNLSVHSKGLENGAGSHMSAFLEMHGTEEQLGDDTSICPDFEATPPNESAQPPPPSPNHRLYE